MRKKTLSIIAAMCAMIMFGFEAKAQDAMARMKKDYPVAMQEYGKKMSELKTDYIIAIDVSATMDKYKDVVVPALTRFFDSIDDGNYVRIVTFGTLAKEEQTRLEINKQTRPQIVKTLNYAYDVVTKDKGMRGYTDFVLLGIKVVELIKNDDDSDIHFIVIFSDLKDDWKKGTAHRPQKDWDELGQQFKSLNAPVNTLSTYFPHEVRDEAQIVKSIELITGAFPNFDYSSDINEVLGQKLEGSKYIIYTDKLKQLISKDLNELGKKELFSSLIARDKSLMLEYDFDKDEVKAPRFIRGIVVDTCILEEKTPEIIDVEFDCHKEIAKRSATRNIGAVSFEKGKIYTQDCSADYKVDYHFIYQVSKDEKANSFTKDMEALELLDKLPQKATVHADGPLVFIWPFWLIVMLCLLIFVFLILLIKNTIIPGRIKGKRFFCTDPVGNKLDYWVENERSFVIGDKDDNWNLKHPEITFKILVKAKNGGPLNLVIKRKVMCYLIASENSAAKMSQTDEGEVTKANILVNPVAVEEGMGQTFTFTITED